MNGAREQVQKLSALGSLPAERDVSQESLEAYEHLLGDITPPVTDDEARVLVGVFGPDDCFGLAWTLLHLIESAPNWPLQDALAGTSNEWKLRLRARAQLGNPKHGPEA